LNLFALLYSAALLASIAEGFFLLLPLYVKQVGGNELDVGWILWGGAAGSLLLVGSMTRLLDVLRPASIAALGCAAYAVGAAIFTYSDHIGWYSILAGFFQGAGVGLCVTSYPIVITGLIEDARRSVHFSVLAAFGIAGMGVSPVLAAFLTKNGISFHQIFLASAIACLVCVAMFVVVNRMIAVAGHPVRADAPTGALRAVVKSEAAFPLIMVFLGASMFSSMMNFQTTFAVSRGLDFQVFYVCYITSTILSRLTLSRLVNKADPRVVIVFLLAVMCASLASFSFVGGSVLLYAIASTLLGSSYGLVYPLIQAHAVNLTAPQLRDKVLAYFSFSYFVAVYGFPVVGGWIIVRNGYGAFIVLLLCVGLAELAVALTHLFLRGRVSTSPAAPGRVNASA